MTRAFFTPLALLLASCATVPPAPGYDLLIRGGTIVDGSGGAPFVGDVAVSNDTVAAVGFTFKDEQGAALARIEYLMVGEKLYGLRSMPV